MTALTKLVWAMAGLILAGAAVFALAGRGGDDNAPAEPTPSATGPAQSGEATETDSGGDVEHDADPLQPGAGAPTWQEAAQGYATAFTNTSGGHDGWRSRLQPWISPGLYDAYGQTDIRVVPTNEFQQLADHKTISSEIPTVEATLVYADDLRLVITVAQDPQTHRWVVTTAVPL